MKESWEERREGTMSINEAKSKRVAMEEVDMKMAELGIQYLWQCREFRRRRRR
jgi:hypothetical protein